MNTMQLAPSAIFSLPNFVSNAVWLRPYVGAGASLYRSTVVTDMPDTAETGLGYQMFGGVELTWSALPQVAASVDLRQQWAPSPSGVELGGFGLALSAHWYVK